MGLLVSYVLVVGGFTASVQVIRGVVRGAGKLIEGEPNAALVEVAGSVMAPVASAVGQACKLGADVCRTAGVQLLRPLEKPWNVTSGDSKNQHCRLLPTA